MSELGVLLAYFANLDEAREALRALRRRGFRRSALLYKQRKGGLEIDRLPLSGRIAWSLAAGVLVAIIAASLVFGLGPGLPYTWTAAALSLSMVLGALAGWFVTERTWPGVDRTVLRKHSSWLVTDEPLVIVQATPAAMTWAVTSLRQNGEVQPSIFALHPVRSDAITSEPLRHAPLTGGQLREHAQRMAEDHEVAIQSGKDESLLRRLDECEEIIERVRSNLTEAARLEQSISPSAEWILDNAYIIQGHINDVRINLPEKFYHELPVLASVRMRGEPRVYAMATECVRHTDGQLDGSNINHFLKEYQSVSSLKIGELWAMPLMLRIALIDSLCRLADLVVARVRERELADFWANRLLTVARREPSKLFAFLAELAEEHPFPSAYFAFQLTGHLYDEETALVPVQSWLERCLENPLADISLQEQGRQAADQVYIGNAITSLRQLSQLDWRDIFEEQSRVEAILRGDPLGVYPAMDFSTRDRYRGVIEEVSRGSGWDEVAVAEMAIDLSQDQPVDSDLDPHKRHVGYYLVDRGRDVLFERTGCRETPRRRSLDIVYRNHTGLYLGAVALMTVLLTAIALALAARMGFQTRYALLAALITLLPASQTALQVVNYLITRLLPPRTLPKLSFEESGVPDEFRTLVVVPMLMTDRRTLRHELEKLEIRYLANPGSNLHFSLFADFKDAPTPHEAEDESLLNLAVDGIKSMNRRHGTNRFYLFSRDRVWCETEGLYVGWERKRGKLEELNRLIIGESPQQAEDIVKVGDPAVLTDIRFVITLDSDTQLPQGSARRLIEAMAHPLNQPRLEKLDGRTTGSYAIVQPRVSTSLPSATATPFSRLFTDPVGTDPYTKAVSDVYQDLAGEGSFIGKGIYDPRAFHAATEDRFPEQTLLSHDLIEGAQTRVGLASDIELFDEFPRDYKTYARRLHRWIRGDWQIAEWCTPWVRSADGRRARNRLSALNRWKIFDNLRRSLVPAALVVWLASAWLISPSLGALASVLTGLLLIFQPLTQVVTWATTPIGSAKMSMGQLGHDLARAVVEAALTPYQAGLALDAVMRVFYRRLISRRKLLEWTTAQMAESEAGGQPRAFTFNMGLMSLSTLLLTAVLWRVQPLSLWPAAPYLLLWFFSPLVAWWLNVIPKPRPKRSRISAADADMLHKLGRRTWRYYDDFVEPETSWLPPDNFQVSHQNQLAMRTSPTNIGLWMLSAIAAHDFGYLTAEQVMGRLHKTFDSLDQLEHYEGHLLNWYDLETLAPLEPRYVSTVDSGNLLACLWTLEWGVKDLVDRPLFGPAVVSGLRDTLMVLRDELAMFNGSDTWPELDALEKLIAGPHSTARDIVAIIEQAVEPAESLAERLRSGAGARSEAAYWSSQIERQVKDWAGAADRYLRWMYELESLPDEAIASLGESWLQARDQALGISPTLRSLAIGRLAALFDVLAEPGGESLRSLKRAMAEARGASRRAIGRADALIERSRELSRGVNMRFLYDPERRLFSIGFNVSAGRLDGSFYDLLASEARLGSFVAVARGDIPPDHWLAMHRPYGSVGRRRVLLSWTGTMFEYLMPNLLQRNFDNSLLDKAAEDAVRLQIEYGRQRGIPWGISESAFGDLDANLTYQYKAFGVPGLGLKRGLEEDLVVAPYASMLSLMIDPGEAIRNLKRLEGLGLAGSYGYFESIDFSRQRQREGEKGVVVRTFMAHHQAMGFLALANLLHDGIMVRRFHADARVRATEPLLYERIPVSPPVYHLPDRDRPPSRVAPAEVTPSVSQFDTPHTDTPKTQLLCNGRYVLMVTGAGGGYSHWGEYELTRWRSDATRDDRGTFVYIKDLDSGETWSNTHHPSGAEAEEYLVKFALDRAEFFRYDAGIETETEIFVSPEDDAEIRRITLINRSGKPRRLQLTSYSELSLAPHSSDLQHPAFNKLFIQTEALRDRRALLAFRRGRQADEPPIFAGHRLTLHSSTDNGVEYETDRQRFIGRGRSLADPAALDADLSNSEGHVLDPIFSLREEIVLAPDQRVQVSLVLCAAETRYGVLNLLDKYSDPQSIARVQNLAWAHSQLELRLLRIQPDEARRFQQLASFLLYPNARLRPPQERLRQNRSGQSGLWPYGISGDLPIALITVGESRDLGVVRQLLQAHTYWRQHGLMVDLAILNEESTAYEQPLYEELGRMIQGHAMYTGVDQPGGIFLRNLDQIPEDDVTLLLSAAHISLVAARGPLAQQLGVRRETVELPYDFTAKSVQEEPSAPLPFLELEYFNGLGGFTRDGGEYVIYLGPGDDTPAPWVNVMANPEFGTLVSESGSGFTWYGNSQLNRLTGWSNDAVLDPPSDAIYLRDEETGVFWSPTPLPVRESEAYRIRHGAGYSVFEHNSHGIEQELTTFVPVDDNGGAPVRIQRLRLRNDSQRDRQISVTFYVEWTLGDNPERTQMHVTTNWDPDTGTILARNRYHPDYSDRVAFASMTPTTDDYTADRSVFLGRNGRPSEPAAMKRVSLAERTGAGIDPCAALRLHLELQPGESQDVICLLGQVESADRARSILREYGEGLALEGALKATRDWWDRTLGAVQIETPDPSANLLLNRWLLYQSLSCRIWGRSGFYQSGGAFGFRDQLQDVLSMLYSRPGLARAHILRAAGRQFRLGDVQHWWHPPSGAGIRSRCSDDLLWLPYAVARYVEVTGDMDVLDEKIPFLMAPPLADEEQEVYLLPEVTTESANLYEHCRMAIDRGLTAGPHGLPLIGAMDWNDGLNRVGVEGKGESVWLAWFLIEVLNAFADLAERCDQPEEAELRRKQASGLAGVIEMEAWDGQWYRRAYFDDGTPIGSASSEEAKIDSLPQSWAWISGAAEKRRAAQALESAWEHLVKREEGLVLLFTPPFDRWALDPGYIKGYPPGVRENGGQYTHAALWLALAFARQGDGDRAAGLLRMLNPIEHSREPEDVEQYKVEPYAVAADVYRLEGHVGRGGWTWYTGSAGWMYRVWMEGLLGLQRSGDSLRVDPVIPAEWEGFSLRVRNGDAVYEISVENPERVSRGVAWMEMDGRRLDDGFIPLERRLIKHKVRVRLGNHTNPS